MDETNTLTTVGAAAPASSDIVTSLCTETTCMRRLSPPKPLSIARQTSSRFGCQVRCAPRPSCSTQMGKLQRCIKQAPTLQLELRIQLRSQQRLLDDARCTGGWTADASTPRELDNISNMHRQRNHACRQSFLQRLEKSRRPAPREVESRPTRGWRSVVRSPSGVRGVLPATNVFLVYFRGRTRSGCEKCVYYKAKKRAFYGS